MELQINYTHITQCNHYKGGVDVMMSKFNTPKNINNNILSNVYKIEGAHLQCVSYHNAKFEHKGMKTAGDADFTNQTPTKHIRMEKCLGLTALKNKKKYLSNVHKIGGTHLQCMNNNYARFEYKGEKTTRVTDYTNQTDSKHFEWKNV